MRMYDYTLFHLCRHKGGAKRLARRRPLRPAPCLLVSSYKDSELTRRRFANRAFPFTPRGAPLPIVL
ncbi:MAG: hypothetical protein PeribacterA2_0246 [Candidatus Peribacter riflensis]|uniref:Uncharacterized protein n=1 Tax=Candidatus Peribacter riflensis TaxID=1735162 RepID=A0A0S1SH83_9BACT|nr:MAG: hypothetical protein PeribacterA2_0246 [Candidatus Peribacter riflensis]ALM10740.1 MAG: hypothetical protein PeribacterB2_0246 [Candidatus Peribacter riflensis]ALM11842.1 MAG: hypothetical protein PeribacterC2_0245 [Candidatus Peribacter riflensis]ALM12945.1 MAG: hypothetical protein PeribacterD1_0246 [Candidatus Peribacter riflensis]ALM14045.1 MAG: hypothetical protein PeribacterD2_0245 [Candidatus Peribacter riflensis]